MKVLGAIAVALLLFTAPAYAIPSPDLIAGSLSSLSQLLTLASAAVGGLAFTGTRLVPSASTGIAASAGRGLRWVLGVALVVLTASLGLNAYQYLARHDARLARLQATLVRPSHDPGMPILDPTLHEMSYAQQVKASDGITTQQLADLLKAADSGAAKGINFIDVRETAETELGVLRHFTPVRWPDLMSSGLVLKGKRNVLICQNGNRSSETCSALNAAGVPCNFVIGGLEKWLAEGRPIGKVDGHARDQLRGVPSYKNDRVLLDTPQVRKLIKNEHAIVVDTRYPGAFAHHHMYGAIDIPIRRMPTAALRQSIAQLPHRPVVLACYDRRSCFMSEVLGLELTRAGFDVRGRYTTPWEYFVPTKEPPYVAQWRARVSASWWKKAARELGGALDWIAAKGAGLPGAILLLALLSRLVVVPFSLKAERDQIQMRAAAVEIAELKARFKSDPKRLTRSLRALHERYGVTPVRNVLALFFLPVLAISVTAVNSAARQQPQGLWWMSDLAARDHTLLLPAAFSIIVVFYLVVSVARTPRQKIVTALIGLPLFGALADYLSGAANLYMLASAGLMLAQRGVIAVDLAAMRRRRVKRRAERAGVIDLAEAHLLPGCGNKAARLGALIAEGLPAPRGLVLTPRFLESFANGGIHRRDLDKVWKRLGATRIAVRSAAAAEDGAEHSFAGVFETVLNVERDGLEAAIAKVHASFTAARTASYGVAAEDGYILLQPMVDADYAGVMFTQAPGMGGLAMVEMVRGTADAFVSGAAAPETCLLGRYSGSVAGEVTPPMDLAPLFALGRRAEAAFDGPQDVEWAYCEGRFQLLQSRDITRTGLDAQAKSEGERLERERGRLLALMAQQGEDGGLAQSEISELLPRPTPLSFDLMESLWRSGGSVDLACRALGLSYRVEEDAPPYLTTAFGRLYVNVREERARAPRIGLLAAMKLERAAPSLEDDYRLRFVPEFSERVRLLEALDFRRLTVPELQTQLERLRAGFVGHTYAQVDVVNIAANYYMERAKTALTARGLNPATHLGEIPETPFGRALTAAGRCDGEEERLAAFLGDFGHRAALDYELSQPRYAEDREAARALVGMADAEVAPKHEGRPAADHDWQDRTLATQVDRARRFQALKEEAKHQVLRELAVLRAILLALDEALGLDGGIFHLTFAEIAVLTRELPVAQARERIAERQADAVAFVTVPPLPAEIGVAQLEVLPLTETAEVAESDGWHKGTLVSGDALVEGRACVVPHEIAERGGPLPDFIDGDVIVSRTIHPAWLPYFRRASGLVCEIGGWLSHIAILAREYEVPMIVGVRTLKSIETGETLRLHPDGRIERVGPVDDEAHYAPDAALVVDGTAALKAAQ